MKKGYFLKKKFDPSFEGGNGNFACSLSSLSIPTTYVQVVAGFRLQFHPFFRQWWWGAKGMGAEGEALESSSEIKNSYFTGTLNRKHTVYDNSLQGQDPTFMYNDGFHNVTDFYKSHSYRDMVNATGLSQFLQTTIAMPTRYFRIYLSLSCSLLNSSAGDNFYISFYHGRQVMIRIKIVTSLYSVNHKIM